MKHNDVGSFYAKGLQFECLLCGRCCTGFPGFVYLSQQDIERIAAFLRLTEKEFVERHTRLVSVFHEKRLSLREKSNFNCVFWNDRCAIYPARPYQCRSFPFWKRQLVSKREWEKAAGSCPGMNRGRVHSREEIDLCLRDVPVYDVDKFSHPVIRR